MREVCSTYVSPTASPATIPVDSTTHHAPGHGSVVAVLMVVLFLACVLLYCCKRWCAWDSKRYRVAAGTSEEVDVEVPYTQRILTSAHSIGSNRVSYRPTTNRSEFYDQEDGLDMVPTAYAPVAVATPHSAGDMSAVPTVAVMYEVEPPVTATVIIINGERVRSNRFGTVSV